MRKNVIALIGVFAAAGAVNASTVTFFGEDLNNSNSVRVAHPNSDSARASFLSNLVGVGTENFESYAAGTGAPLAVTFPGAGTATMTGTGQVEQVSGSGTNGFGRYPISGTKFWSGTTGGDNFVITFSAPVAAFGFYGVDVGDFGGSLTLTLAGGGSEIIDVGNTVGGNGSTDGSVLYFGLIRSTGGITSISFNNSSGADVFAFDDFSVGSIEQVNLVPTPTAALAGGLMLSGLVGYGRRRRA